jgi:hypothetical protein
MTIWAVIWVVLMILWLFGGGYATYNGPNANPAYFGTYCLLPWLCVLILGLVLFGAVSPGAGVVLR